jgi:hypothetical protein
MEWGGKRVYDQVYILPVKQRTVILYGFAAEFRHGVFAPYFIYVTNRDDSVFFHF